MKNLRKALVGVVALFTLYACSSGGGGGGVTVPPPPATALTGTVTDTALEPVPGATVTILGTASTTTDAAGRYSFTALPASTEYTLKFSGPGPSYFPTFAKATLTENSPSVLDVYLTRAGNIAPLPTVDASAGGTAISDAFIDGPQFAALNLIGNDLVDGTGTTYTGTATVHLAPIDVGKLGFGLASYQSTLGGVFAALTANSQIVELFGSAAVEFEDTTGNPLNLVSTSTSTLELPIPASPAGLRLNAPPQVFLWYLDENTGAWIKQDTPLPQLQAAKNGTLDAYVGEISRAGIWRAGVELDITTTPTILEITGRAIYNNGAPAAGATVYVSGQDYAYQTQATTDANGAFSLLAKDGGVANLHFIVAANGAQWAHETASTIFNSSNAAQGDITLPYAPPLSNGVAITTITVDDRDSAIGQGPDVLGYILASGRQVSDPDPDPDLIADNVADFTFVASPTDLGNGLISLTPTTNGLGIQAIAGTFEALTTAPTGGYIITPTTFGLNLEPGVTTLPLLVAIKTRHRHFGKISIDSVTPNTISASGWDITFRHAFSLTGSF